MGKLTLSLAPRTARGYRSKVALEDFDEGKIESLVTDAFEVASAEAAARTCGTAESRLMRGQWHHLEILLGG